MIKESMIQKKLNRKRFKSLEDKVALILAETTKSIIKAEIANDIRFETTLNLINRQYKDRIELIKSNLNANAVYITSILVASILWIFFFYIIKFS
jgi:hypothetical protein